MPRSVPLFAQSVEPNKLQPNGGAEVSISLPVIHDLRNHLAAIEGFAQALGDGRYDTQQREFIAGILRNVARCTHAVDSFGTAANGLGPAANLGDRPSSEWLLQPLPLLEGVNVLLVEDDDDVAQVTATLLGRAGARVRRVCDGEEVLPTMQSAAAVGHVFAAILMDIHMARMNGIEAIVQARSLDPEVFIAVLTSDGSPAVREASLKCGASAFLIKPIDYSTLPSWLSFRLGQASKEAQAEAAETRVSETRVAVAGLAEEPTQGGGSGATASRGDGGAEVGVRRVLIVDDNEDSAEAMGQVLQRLGYHVELAYNGLTAIQHVRQQAPDVVLLDLQLPDMHGTQVAQSLRSGGYTGKLVALSGDSDRAMRERCASAGVDLFLSKPCSFQELRAAM